MSFFKIFSNCFEHWICRGKIWIYDKICWLFQWNIRCKICNEIRLQIKLLSPYFIVFYSKLITNLYNITSLMMLLEILL